MIVDARGQSTINFEHSWGDGVAVLRLMEESYRDTNRNHFVDPNQQVDQNVPIEKHCRPIEFTLNDSLKGAVADAQSKHLANGSSLQFGIVEYFGMTRDSLKKAKLSPDAMMQLAIQLAFHRLYKDFVPTYESCSTAAFLKGDSLDGRVCDCSGEGFDRHLMALRMTAERLGRKQPALFSNSYFKYMNEFILSTSTLS
ncbi:unnamed protein product, partial [Anisakis simplex]